MQRPNSRGFLEHCTIRGFGVDTSGSVASGHMTDQSNPPAAAPTDSIRKAALDRATERQDLWIRQFRRWNSTHYLLGISGLVATLSGVVLPVVGATALTLEIIAGASAIIFGAVAFIQPPRRARGYITAWRKLDAVVGRFEANMVDLEALLSAVEEGEEILAGGEPY